MTVDVYEELRRRALARIDGTGIDPESQPEAVRELLESTVEEYQRRAHLGEGLSLADPQATLHRLVQSVSGQGPLARLLDRASSPELPPHGKTLLLLGEATHRGCETGVGRREPLVRLERRKRVDGGAGLLERENVALLIGRDPNGYPNGQFADFSANWGPSVPQNTNAAYQAKVADYRNANRVGITLILHPGGSVESLSLLKRVADDGNLTVRVNQAISAGRIRGETNSAAIDKLIAEMDRAVQMPGVTGVGRLVPKITVPNTVTGLPTTFSPAARFRYQPLKLLGSEPP